MHYIIFSISVELQFMRAIYVTFLVRLRNQFQLSSVRKRILCLRYPFVYCCSFHINDAYIFRLVFYYTGLVAALRSLYVALESPVLPGWVASGGDPCGEAWQGVQCDGGTTISSMYEPFLELIFLWMFHCNLMLKNSFL